MLYMHVRNEINGNSGVLCVCYILIIVFFEDCMLLFVVNSCRIINSSLDNVKIHMWSFIEQTD